MKRKKTRHLVTKWRSLDLRTLALGSLLDESWNQVLQYTLLRQNRNAQIKARIAAKKRKRS